MFRLVSLLFLYTCMLGCPFPHVYVCVSFYCTWVKRITNLYGYPISCGRIHRKRVGRHSIDSTTDHNHLFYHIVLSQRIHSAAMLLYSDLFWLTLINIDMITQTDIFFENLQTCETGLLHSHITF